MTINIKWRTRERAKRENYTFLCTLSITACKIGHKKKVLTKHWPLRCPVRPLRISKSTNVASSNSDKSFSGVVQNRSVKPEWCKERDKYLLRHNCPILLLIWIKHFYLSGIVVRCGSKNGHQKCMFLKKIRLHIQNMLNSQLRKPMRSFNKHKNIHFDNE